MTTPAADWHPLLRLASSRWLGEVDSDEGVLWTGGDVEPFRQLDLDQAVACLPLLERSLDGVLTDVARAEDMCRPATGRALRRLVPAVVVETALRSESDYWLDLACRWLSAMEPSDRTAGWARRIEGSAFARQAVRHEARRVRRRWSVR